MYVYPVYSVYWGSTVLIFTLRFTKFPKAPIYTLFRCLVLSAHPPLFLDGPSYSGLFFHANVTCSSHATGCHALGDTTCLYTHFWGAKASFSYINLQATDPVGGSKIMQNFSFGGQCPCTPCRYVPDLQFLMFCFTKLKLGM